MSTLRIAFIIPTEFTTRENTLSLLLLKEKGIPYFISPYNEVSSGVIVEGNIHTLLECFYVLKNDIIRKIDDLVDVVEGESYDRYYMEMYIPNNIVAFFIGKNGVAIENIRQMAYAKITIEQKDTGYEEMTSVQFQGDHLGIPQAVNLVFNRILTLNPRLSWIYPSPHRMSNLTDTIGNVLHFSRSDDYSMALMNALNPNVTVFGYLNDAREDREFDAFVTFRIDAKKAGSVIGTGGKVVSEIRNSTSTQIYLNQDADSCKCRRVEITGKLSNVIQASNQIMDIIAQN